MHTGLTLALNDVLDAQALSDRLTSYTEARGRELVAPCFSWILNLDIPEDERREGLGYLNECCRYNTQLHRDIGALRGKLNTAAGKLDTIARSLRGGRYRRATISASSMAAA